MLITSYDNLVLSYNNNKIKWKCGSHFLFTLLPTLCEWYVQDSVFRSDAYPTHITSTHVISKFTRYKEWADRQRKKNAYLAENQLKDRRSNCADINCAGFHRTGTSLHIVTQTLI